ncbi:MAG: tyrosine-type recombinase/integrase [Candidatus Thermoplasmatota archaeon]|nr:tyrosine-type recombinase/integrase [Candidatus Thermoplasmatota archaeon]
MDDTATEARQGDTVTDLLHGYEQWMRVKRDNNEVTIENMLERTQQFLKWLGEHGRALQDVDQATVDAYIDDCTQRYSHNSMVPITANLRKLLVYYMRKDIDIRLAKMKAPKIDKTPLSQEEVDAIFQEARKDGACAEAIVKTLYYAGLRMNELINLDIGDVDFNRLQLVIRHGKGDRFRIVNITKSCAIALQQWLTQRPKAKEGHEQALFLSSQRQRICNATVRQWVKKFAAQAGIANRVYPHKFRISMITHMAEAGCTPKEIQAQSGHRDFEVLLGYINHSSPRIRRVYDEVFSNDSDIKPSITVPDTFDKDFFRSMTEQYINGIIDKDTYQRVVQAYEVDKRSHHPTDIGYV